MTDFAANNPAILYSPYTWLVTAGNAKTTAPGAYCRTLFAGTPPAIDLRFDLTGVTTAPQIVIRVNGGPWQRQTIAAVVPVTIPAGNTWGRVYVEWVVKSTQYNAQRWVPPLDAVVTFLGYTATATLETIRARDRYILVFGDSITEGLLNVATAAAQPVLTDQADASVCWSYLLGEAMGAEVGVVGFGATGFSVTGVSTAGTVVFGSSWPNLWSGQARPTATPQAPDAVVINIGHNDGTNNIVATATAVLNAMLAAYPVTTKIVVLRPFGGLQAANLQAAVAATGSGRVTYVDTTGWFNVADASDGVHPYGYASLAYLSQRVAGAVRGALGDGASWLKRSDGTLKRVTNVRI